MEGLKLDQAQLERLVELDRKFSGDGLTFDDVLLVPAESRVLPNDVSTAAGAQDRDSARLRGDGHSDRGAPRERAELRAVDDGLKVVLGLF